MMKKLTHRILAHKRAVAISWILLTLVGMAAAGPASEALDQKFTVPGKEGWETNQEILKKYGNGSENPPFVPVVTVPKGESVSSPAVRAELRGLEAKLKEISPRSRIAGYASTANAGSFVSKDGRTTFIAMFPPPSDEPFGGNPDLEKELSKALSETRIAGAPVHLTGWDALADDAGGNEGPGVLIEALIGGAGALLVLVFVFGSWLALVPLVMAICSILTTFLLLWGLTAITEVSPIVQFLCALIGLGVSIDYALLVVMRWREERDKGLPNEEAVEQAMATAGRAVVFSGTTVAIGLLALIVMPLPFLRSVGYGGLLIPLVATLVAITLLPVVLASIGPKLDKRRLRRSDDHHAGWERWSRGVVRHRILAVGGSVLILGVLLVSATNLQFGNGDPNTIAKSGDAKDGLVALQDSGIGNGVIYPIETLVPERDAEAVQRAQADVDGVNGAIAPTGPEWRKGGDAIVAAFTRDGDDKAAGRDQLDGVQEAAHNASAQARVGGTTAVNEDFIDAVYGSFPLMIALIALISFILLARAFRSLLLPAKAVILNVLSVGAAWGVVMLVWQQGHGSSEIWGIDPTGAIASWIPLMIFAFLYGLSMDYEVFILARMREEYDRTGDTNEAVVLGLGRTGRLVTSAALILFLAFAALASGPQTDTKIMATGLAAGILLDATVIRALLVPAVVSLFGKWNWWLPPGPAKLLRVRPSPDPAAESAGG